MPGRRGAFPPRTAPPDGATRARVEHATRSGPIAINRGAALRPGALPQARVSVAGKAAPITPDIAVGSASGYPDLKTLDAAMAEHRGYGRWGTENHRQLEAAVASLESNGLENRLDAVAVGSGMAAIAVALMSEMNAGDHVVAAHDCYGTTLTFVRDDLSRFGITSSIVDFQDLDAVKHAITDRTRLLLCEMCTNPLIRVPDLEALAGIAHEAGA